MTQDELDYFIRFELMTPPEQDLDFIATRVSYRQLYILASSILAALPENETRVCLYSEDRALMAAAVLAALARGFSLIIPHTDSWMVLTEIQKEEHIDAVITDQARNLPQTLRQIIPQPNGSLFLGHHLRVDLDREIFSFYTGGSTGSPTKWAKSPRNLLAEAIYHTKALGVTRNDCILSTVPAQHIYGFLFTILVPMLAKAHLTPRICTFPEEIRSDLAEFQSSLLVSVPVHYRSFRTCPLTTDHNLRNALSSAGVLEAKDGMSFFEQTATHVTEIYGSTETGGIASRSQSRGEQAFTPFAPIDWKIDGPEQQLMVRSPFLPPSLPKDKDGFYTTGDRAQAWTEHSFVLLGRTDGIVKVAGKRVDLDVVQDKLKSIPGVEDAVVLHLPDATGRQTEICAIIQGQMDRKYILREAVQRIEPYALPRRTCIVDQIPTSSTGKYNRQVLIQMLDQAIHIT